MALLWESWPDGYAIPAQIPDIMIMKTALRNQPPIVITLGVLVVMAVIGLSPMEAIFSKANLGEFSLEYATLAIKMGLLFLMGYGLIQLLQTRTLAGLASDTPWRNKSLNLIPVYLFIIALLSLPSKDLSLVEPGNLILLLFACLMVGFAEEYLFRGLLQPLFLKKYASREKGIFLSILIPAMCFGLFHLINLAKSDSTGQVLVQVVFATFIGFFFGVLVLKTQKLIPIAITHGLINFFFSLAFVPGWKPVEEDVADTVSIAPIILFLPLLIAGLLIYRKLDKKEIIEKLNMET
jgi:membrane protease YdiL (CAAX protease family)